MCNKGDHDHRMLIVLHGSLLLKRPLESGGAVELRAGEAFGILSALAGRAYNTDVVAGHQGCQLGVIPASVIAPHVRDHVPAIVSRMHGENVHAATELRENGVSSQTHTRLTCSMLSAHGAEEGWQRQDWDQQPQMMDFAGSSSHQDGSDGWEGSNEFSPEDDGADQQQVLDQLPRNFLENFIRLVRRVHRHLLTNVFRAWATFTQQRRLVLELLSFSLQDRLATTFLSWQRGAAALARENWRLKVNELARDLEIVREEVRQKEIERQLERDSAGRERQTAIYSWNERLLQTEQQQNAMDNSHIEQQRELERLLDVERKERARLAREKMQEALLREKVEEELSLEQRERQSERKKWEQEKKELHDRALEQSERARQHHVALKASVTREEELLLQRELLQNELQQLRETVANLEADIEHAIFSMDAEETFKPGHLKVRKTVNVEGEICEDAFPGELHGPREIYAIMSNENVSDCPVDHGEAALDGGMVRVKNTNPFASPVLSPVPEITLNDSPEIDGQKETRAPERSLEPHGENLHGIGNNAQPEAISGTSSSHCVAVDRSLPSLSPGQVEADGQVQVGAAESDAEAASDRHDLIPLSSPSKSSPGAESKRTDRSSCTEPSPSHRIKAEAEAVLKERQRKLSLAYPTMSPPSISQRSPSTEREMISKCGHDITDPTGGFESDETASELQRAGVGGVDRLPGRAEATCLAPCLTPLTISIADADAKNPNFSPVLIRLDSTVAESGLCATEEERPPSDLNIHDCAEPPSKRPSNASDQETNVDRGYVGETLTPAVTDSAMIDTHDSRVYFDFVAEVEDAQRGRRIDIPDSEGDQAQEHVHIDESHRTLQDAGSAGNDNILNRSKASSPSSAANLLSPVLETNINTSHLSPAVVNRFHVRHDKNEDDAGMTPLTSLDWPSADRLQHPSLSPVLSAHETIDYIKQQAHGDLSPQTSLTFHTAVKEIVTDQAGEKESVGLTIPSGSSCKGFAPVSPRLSFDLENSFENTEIEGSGHRLSSCRMPLNTAPPGLLPYCSPPPTDKNHVEIRNRIGIQNDTGARTSPSSIFHVQEPQTYVDGKVSEEEEEQVKAERPISMLLEMETQVEQESLVTGEKVGQAGMKIGVNFGLFYDRKQGEEGTLRPSSSYDRLPLLPASPSSVPVTPLLTTISDSSPRSGSRIGLRRSMIPSLGRECSDESHSPAARSCGWGDLDIPSVREDELRGNPMERVVVPTPTPAPLRPHFISSYALHPDDLRQAPSAAQKRQEQEKSDRNGGVVRSSHSRKEPKPLPKARSQNLCPSSTKSSRLKSISNAPARARAQQVWLCGCGHKLSDTRLSLLACLLACLLDVLEEPCPTSLLSYCSGSSGETGARDGRSNSKEVA